MRTMMMMMMMMSIDGVYYSTKKKNNEKNMKTSVSSRTARILERLFFALEKERRSTFSSCR